MKNFTIVITLLFALVSIPAYAGGHHGRSGQRPSISLGISAHGVGISVQTGRGCGTTYARPVRAVPRYSGGGQYARQSQLTQLSFQHQNDLDRLSFSHQIELSQLSAWHQEQLNQVRGDRLAVNQINLDYQSQVNQANQTYRSQLNQLNAEYQLRISQVNMYYR